MKASVKLGSALCLLLALSLVSMAQNQEQQRGPSRAAMERIEREVTHEILMQPQYGVFDSLGFKVDGYNVTLVGSIRNATLKSQVEAAVKNIEGVEEVKNEIEILPVSQNDDRIRMAAFRGIYGEPPLDMYAMQAVHPIHIVVKNGQITLEGQVTSKAHKNLAEVRVRSVPGAFGVTNNLTVQGN